MAMLARRSAVSHYRGTAAASAPLTGQQAWGTTDASVGFPSGLNYVSYTDSTYGYQTGDSFAQTLARMATKYGSSGFIALLPNGFDVSILDFAQYSTYYQSGTVNVQQAYGFARATLQGFLCVAGPTQARIKQADNSLSSNQINGYTASNGDAVKGLSTQTSGDGSTTQIANAYFPYTANPLYIGGITFEGGLQTVNKLQGINLYHGGSSSSIIQYVRILAGGYASGNTPPTETFALQEQHSQNLLIRHFEIDGRLRTDTSPVGSSGFVNPTMGTKVSGMFGANSAQNITLEDGYLHDNAASMLTFSYAGSQSSPTNGVTTRRIHTISGGGVSGTAVNHEAVIGTVAHYDGFYELATAATAWTAAHFTWCGPNANGTLMIYNPQWSGDTYNAPGYLNIRTYQWYDGSNFENLQQPRVFKADGTEYQCIIRGNEYGNMNSVPAGSSPQTHFIWSKGA